MTRRLNTATSSSVCRRAGKLSRRCPSGIYGGDAATGPDKIAWALLSARKKSWQRCIVDVQALQHRVHGVSLLRVVSVR
jgi:hypothetical protein